MPKTDFQQNLPKTEPEFIEKVVQIKRVSNKTKGGNQISFTALTVSGDKKSKVGVGLGKAKSVADANQKSIKKARKNMIEVPMVNGTIPHEVTFKYHGAIVLIRPGKAGSGLIAGGPVRAVVEVAGVKDMVSKIIGSKNKSLNVWATLQALTMLKK
jgi:small subunit ribosomal protein S5